MHVYSCASPSVALVLVSSQGPTQQATQSVGPAFVPDCNVVPRWRHASGEEPGGGGLSEY